MPPSCPDSTRDPDIARPWCNTLLLADPATALDILVEWRKQMMHTIFEEECQNEDVHPSLMRETNKWCNTIFQEECHHSKICPGWVIESNKWCNTISEEECCIDDVHPGRPKEINKWCTTIFDQFEEECCLDDIHPGWMTEMNKWCGASPNEKCHQDDTTQIIFFRQWAIHAMQRISSGPEQYGTSLNTCYAEDLIWSWTVL